MGALVNICDANGKIVARGITSYSQNDIEKIKGRHSTEIETLLGNCHYEEVVHRDNLVVMEEKFEWKK
jgi:glutamate 5-kinase